MNPNLTVPADVPREVLAQLRDDAGLTYVAIARRTGVARSALCRLATAAHVRVGTADALYALQAEVEMERPDLARKWAVDEPTATR